MPANFRRIWRVLSRQRVVRSLLWPRHAEDILLACIPLLLTEVHATSSESGSESGSESDVDLSLEIGSERAEDPRGQLIVGMR